MTSTAGSKQGFLDGVRRISEDVAAPAADAVDRESRFPHETVAALRAVGALSAFVPVSRGGEGVRSPISPPPASSSPGAAPRRGWSTRCTRSRSPRSCATCAGSAFFDDYLGDLVAEQRLIASATSEVGVGGDLRTSIAAVTPEGAGVVFEKQAPTISYGAHADDLLTTAAPAPDAEPQRPGAGAHARGRATLEHDGLVGLAGHARHVQPGLRRSRAGSRPTTCSRRRSREIAAQTMVPVTHILWAHVWLGIATAAYDRARAFVRAAGKRKPGLAAAGGGAPLALCSELHAMRAEVSAATERVPERSIRGEPATTCSRWRSRSASTPSRSPRPSGAAHLPGRARRSAGSSATRTTRRSASAATSATRCPPA